MQPLAHVFRRNFGGATGDLQAGDRPPLGLARGETAIPEGLDVRLIRFLIDVATNISQDEVLHVSNAPLFISTNDTYSKIGVQQWGASPALDLDEKTDAGVNEQLIEEQWKAKEKLLLATQDVFYFDYGCVVFW